MLICPGVRAIAAPDSEASAAYEIITCAIVLRKNWSYLYQHLDTSHILQPLLDNGIITEDVRKQVQSYVPKCAQNVVLVKNFFHNKAITRALNILIAAIGEKHIAQKLTEGKHAYLLSTRKHFLSPTFPHNILPTHYWLLRGPAGTH